MDFSLWIEAYPEFAHRDISPVAYETKKAIATLYMSHTVFTEESAQYNLLLGLLIAHLFFMQFSGGNSITQAKSLESSVNYEIAQDPYLSLGASYYGRIVIDMVKLNYMGGLAGAIGNCYC